MSLDTLSNLKTRLGISGSGDDALLGLLQDSADRLIARHCERDFGGGSFTEYHPGGTPFIHLRNYPVASVASVKVDPAYGFGPETLVEPGHYVTHVEWGVIQSLSGPFLPRWGVGLVNSELRIWTRGPRIVQVVYSTAAGAVPDDVKQAYARLIGLWYRRVKTEIAQGQLEVNEQRYGDTIIAYARSSPGAIPSDVRELLAPYRAPNL